MRTHCSTSPNHGSGRGVHVGAVSVHVLHQALLHVVDSDISFANVLFDATVRSANDTDVALFPIVVSVAIVQQLEVQDRLRRFGG